MSKKEFSTYLNCTNRSASLHEEANQYMPGGDSRSVTYHSPHPTFVKSASGCKLLTVDDEELLDFVNNYTQSVLGHAPERVVEAACEKFRRGNGLGAPTEDIIRLAEILSDRIPSVERIRFANSGTEATMNAIRGAMAYTHCEEILKVRGGYHGTHDSVEIGVGRPGRANIGIPKDVEERVHTVPFNDVGCLEREISKRADELACFIIEPIMGAGGMIPAEQEYLRAARDFTEEHDIILIFDEVMSFRLAHGGAQERYGVTPDLTALGKAIGGGLPVGAFGGKQEIMSVFHPERGEVNHSGTFNANPATMAGGVATMEELDSDVINRINDLGAEVRQGLRAISADLEIPIKITGDGSFFFIHFTEDEVKDAKSSTAGCESAKDLFLSLRNGGVFFAPRGMGNLSAPMGQSEVKELLTMMEHSLNKIEEESKITA